MDEQAAPTSEAPAGAAVDAPTTETPPAPDQDADAAVPAQDAPAEVSTEVGTAPSDADAVAPSQSQDATTTQDATAAAVAPPDPMAQLEDDNSAFVLGIVPLLFMSAFAVACVVLFFVRRRQNWNELDDALRIDGGDTPVGADEHFTTQDMQEMGSTKPSQRVSELKD